MYHMARPDPPHVTGEIRRLSQLIKGPLQNLALLFFLVGDRIDFICIPLQQLHPGYVYRPIARAMLPLPEKKTDDSGHESGTHHHRLPETAERYHLSLYQD